MFKFIALLLLASCGTHRNYAPHHHHLGKANCVRECKVKATEEGLDRHNSKITEHQLYHDGRYYYFSDRENYVTFKSQIKD